LLYFNSSELHILTECHRCCYQFDGYLSFELLSVYNYTCFTLGSAPLLPDAYAHLHNVHTEEISIELKVSRLLNDEITRLCFKVFI